MTDHTELKLAAEAASQGRWNQDGFDVQNDDINDYRVARCNRLADAKFIAAANPAAVLALIAENDALAGLLKRFVDGEHDDEENQAERHIYFTEAQSLLALVNGELEAHTIVPDFAIKAIHDERDQLHAENAGLKTGYEAYERVNAELKAEVEELRKYGEEFAVLAERRREEADALRKDSESYRLLSFCHGQGTLQLVRSHHELCDEIRRLKILAGEPVPPTPEEFIGPSPEGPTARIRRKLAAIGKGEQS